MILFGLSAQLAPRLNTVQVGFPYIMKFLAENPRPPAATDARPREASALETSSAGPRGPVVPEPS